MITKNLNFKYFRSNIIFNFLEYSFPTSQVSRKIKSVKRGFKISL